MEALDIGLEPWENPAYDEHEIISAGDTSELHIAPTVAKLKPVPGFRTKPPVLGGTPENPIILNEGMSVPQRVAYLNRSKCQFVVAGYGSGKSLGLFKKLKAVAEVNNGVECWLIAPTLPLSDRLHRFEFFQLLIEKKCNPKWIGGLQRLIVWRCPYSGLSGTVRLLSAFKPASLVGSNIASIFVDEVFLCKYEIFDRCWSRLRNPGGKVSIFYGTGTPETLGGWYDLVLGNTQIRGASINPFVMRMTTYSNKTFARHYLIGAGQVDDKQHAAYYEGRMINMAVGRVYYAFDRAKNVKNWSGWENDRVFVGLDFNVDPMIALCAKLLEGPNGEEIIYIFKEIALAPTNTEEMCVKLINLFGHRLTMVYPDPTGRARDTTGRRDAQSDFAIMDAYGIPWHDLGKSVPIDNRGAVNAALAPLASPPVLYISGECIYTIRCFESYTYENMLKPDGKKLSHGADAANYLIAGLRPIARPSLSGSIGSAV